ncbi:hypothetical protein K3495_g4595 [Podosphaera aphanis]|nr:hypothetical protein K3495_g4595 [Podosphaera aphanis]
MAEDVRNYIASCIKCARYSIAQRSQLQSPVRVDAPGILFGIDFIGPLPATDLTAKDLVKLNWPTIAKYDDEDYLLDFDEGFYVSEDRKGLTVSYILVIVDYFSRFIEAFATIGNTSYEVVRCLEWKFSRDGCPVGFNGDEGSHFTGFVTKEFLRKNQVIWISAPSGAKKATGIVEKCNDLLQRILKKSEAGKLWPFELQECVFNMNLRVIDHLGFSPFEIEKGYQPTGILETRLPSTVRTDAIKAVVETNLLTMLEHNSDYHDDVFNFIAKREGKQFKALGKSDWRKMLQKERHDRCHSLNKSAYAAK